MNFYDIGEKIKKEMTLVDIHSYFSTFGETFIYKFEAEGDIFVWYTSKFLDANKGSLFEVEATVKEGNEFRGEKQIVITRAKCHLIRSTGTYDDFMHDFHVEQQEKKERWKNEKKKQQLDDMRPYEKIVRMKYKVYKNKYPNNTTIIDSYDPETSTIEVIVDENEEV